MKSELVRETTDFTNDGPFLAWYRFRRLAAARPKTELEINAAYRAAVTAAEAIYDKESTKLRNELEERSASLQRTRRREREAALDWARREGEALQAAYDMEIQDAEGDYHLAKRKLEANLKDQRWEANAILEAARQGIVRRRKELDDFLKRHEARMNAVLGRAMEVLRRRRQVDPQKPVDLPPGMSFPDPRRQLGEVINQADDACRRLAGLYLPGLFEGARPVGIFILVWLVLFVITAAVVGWTNWGLVFIVSAASAVVVAAVLGLVGSHFAAKQTRHAFHRLKHVLAIGEKLRRKFRELEEEECDRIQREETERYRTETDRFQREFDAEVARLDTTRTRRIDTARSHFPPRIKETAASEHERIRRIESEYSDNLARTEKGFQTRTAEATAVRDTALAEAAETRDAAMADLADRWRRVLDDTQNRLDASVATAACRFPPLASLSAEAVLDAAAEDCSAPPAVPLGTFPVDLAAVEGGLPDDPAMRPHPAEFAVPAWFSFDEHACLALKCRGEGRKRGQEFLRTAMLRILTAFPPGRVRFTVIDPVGLGETFSAFMHLADHDEKLISNRIWTDAAHIDQRLTDLTRYMETVLQAYLRNEYATIQEYNAAAGEMAEPYRILVVAGFPHNFSENAVKRLTSIITSGRRCGVYTLLSLDADAKPADMFHEEDLDENGIVLEWDAGRFVWNRPAPFKLDASPEAVLDDDGFAEPVAPDVDTPVERSSIDVEPSPPPDRASELIHAVGKAALEATKVEVPFYRGLPERSDWWTARSTEQVDVPLGSAGAMKLQRFTLGKGLSQHVLVAGKTGSGKSTLWHALITNLAVHYSPDEVELYLIDFKKGVEFKAYAAHELPHARVIAIESEREFGLSVLERVDEELRRRGDLFRNTGVQDIRGFRAAVPETIMPRVLLIIEEFQELFVEDDRLAQRASLLLDRLVRQGRAFGIHVLLGSQTLGGSYSLPRSTLGQMAVRIALQCSESDAHLILSEENTAARLLTRPGEAIYNDANGLYEGNHPFQVFWLPDYEREEYLGVLREKVASLGHKLPPRIVFEGNVPADIRQNDAISALMNGKADRPKTVSPTAWLGAAVAIKEPTAVRFGRQHGENLLLVGHRDELVQGIFTSMTVSLALQSPGARFVLFDGSRTDERGETHWADRLSATLGEAFQVYGPRDAAEAIEGIAQEAAERQTAHEQDRPPIYILAYNLPRFRALRQDDEDFSFGSFGEDKPPSPAARFSSILSDGPVVGIHTFAWCDSYNNVNRSLDRRSLKEFELRIVFQLNPTDSSQLIDSPGAAHLGALPGPVLRRTGRTAGEIPAVRVSGRGVVGGVEDERRKAEG